jgi:acyl-CoA thioesterase I
VLWFSEWNSAVDVSGKVKSMNTQATVSTVKQSVTNWLFSLLLTGLVWSFGTNAAQSASVQIMAFGDSITAGLGLMAEDSLPAQLKQRLLADGFDVDVINAGISGDTTANGVARLDTALAPGRIDLAIIELGINDMWRGVNPTAVRANLEKIIAALQANGVTVLLTATVSDDRNGQAYKQVFDAIYPDLAEKYRLTLIPFILDGIWGNDALLIDGAHPNAAGVTEMVKKIAPYVEKTLRLTNHQQSGMK